MRTVDSEPPKNRSVRAARTCRFEVDHAEDAIVLQHEPTIIEALWQSTQDFAPRIGNEDIILDSDSEVTIEIDSGFDGDNHAGSERLVARRGQAGRLVDLQTDAVSQTMLEGGIKPGSLQHGAGGTINIARGDTWTNCLNGRQLGLQDRLVATAELGRGRIPMKRSS